MPLYPPLNSAGIPDGTVSNADLANMVTKTYKGRTSGSTGAPEDVPVATVKADLVLVKGDVGLGNVDNTSDLNKPLSTLQITALSIYNTVLQAGGALIKNKVALTYGLPNGQLLIDGSPGTTYSPAVIYIAAADWPAVGSKVPKLRIRVQLYTNDVAPTGNFTFGLHPVTRPATSGGDTLNIYTFGTVVAGSNGASFTTPAADGLFNAVGADFDLPADGHYAICVVTTQTTASNSNTQVVAQLQLHHV